MGIRPLVAASVLFISAAANAEGIVFKWVDKQGNLHVTDTLADVPEPYYSVYKERLDEARQAQKNGAPVSVTPRPGPARPAPPLLSVTADEARRRESWKSLAKHWRNELLSATAALAEVEEGATPMATNPLLQQTPQGKAAATDLDEARKQAQARVEQARRMLTVELPERARREGVPPAWLL